MANTHHRRKQHCKDSSGTFFRDINIQFLIHELKGPLNVIETNIRMLLELQHELGRLTASQQKVLKRSFRSTAKLRSIVHSLLEVGSCRTGRIERQRFNVAQCTATVLASILDTDLCDINEAPKRDGDPVDYLAANGIILSVQEKVQNICMVQDREKFSYILGNLVRNSLRFRKSRVVVQVAASEQNIEISVSDDGPGIGPEDRALLFKCYAHKRPHAHLRPKGHGLGLASSRILARYLGGDIFIDDQCAEGARFVLRLPLTLDDHAAAKTGRKTHDGGFQQGVE